MIASYPDHQTKPDLIQSLLLSEELVRRELRGNFFKFLVHFWPTIIPDPFVYNWHIKYLCDELQALGRYILKRQKPPYDLIINIPPGTSKTTITSIMWPNWLWVNDPTIRTIIGSFELSLATDINVKGRDVLRSYEFKRLYGDEIKPKEDGDNKRLLENTRQGQRIVTSVGGSITGRHAHVQIIDDPIDPARSQSAVERKKAIDWITKTLPSRKVDKELTPTVLIMQRLHTGDPTGFMLAEQGESYARPIRHINLPAEITDLNNVRPHVLKTQYKDGLLDPKRMSREVLEGFKSGSSLGPTEYAGQFLQSPRQDGGNIWKLHWWRYYKVLPMRPKAVYQSWDTAVKDKTINDFNVCTTWNEYENGYYLVDMFCERMQYPELKRTIVSKYNESSPLWVLIEDKASGSPAVQELSRDTKIPIKPIDPETKDKIERASSASPMIETGNIYLPENAPWLQKFLDQTSGFPNVDFDDIVDSVSQFINFIKGKGSGTVRGVAGGVPSLTKDY